MLTLSTPHQIPAPAPAGDPAPLEALRRIVDEQIGPRAKGTIYQNSDGAFEVLSVIREPQRARELLKRRCAQWVVIVRNVLRPDAEPFAVGSVWTDSDHLVLHEAGTDEGEK